MMQKRRIKDPLKKNIIKTKKDNVMADTQISVTKNIQDLLNKAKIMKIALIHQNLSHLRDLNILLLLINKKNQNINLFLMESILFLMQSKMIIPKNKNHF